ncbi:uncharacterized protein AKAW2_11157A [Aspergillus luchuensis]|uniref:Arylsulfotransferase n=1 Tax=Aspergillus kawachii TaxID=1069201 RepID=A0A146FFE7_ASPKA|nr:uncharacterized protein AKAW2_11157A [Aspergillus luchuensis]BCR94111.1 hypothetical protein AKAW2_11157A [Aspergillus luchuensis]BCS06721.1 hypothetical protein ALUC_11102A [Aspergillus luchuensis]GAA84268.1 arylsulfotransferase [Aspergillus luchuensis IFO 4308]GAT24061.1 arylsulfotransferase [Aspergillus luchuensis]
MIWCLFALLFSQFTFAQRHDEDLMSFVTLPEVRALKWEITHHDRDRAAPGYWFVAPYGMIDPESPTRKYLQYQVGPYIYDQDGVLIWAGSPMFDNRNTFDFKAVHNIDDKPHLSLIAQRTFDETVPGSGLILSQHYEVESEVFKLNDTWEFNVHEFKVMDGGKTALACVYQSKMLDMADVGRPGEQKLFLTGGFAELDLATGAPLFEWDSSDHLGLHETDRFHTWEEPMGQWGFDSVHMNAVDKNEAGDYIISMRFTDTIYMISGVDGRVMWRLGGRETNFVQDFVFSKQHDVKFVSSNGTHHIISFLNNASDEITTDEIISSALFVELDTTANPMTARLIARYNRPDGQLSRLRGNTQLLPNGNVFVGWSQSGYQSEFSPEGKVLMTARFASDRFSTYRAYKYEFTGRPRAPPDLVASVSGTTEDDVTTIVHVSWNGATDVAAWNFYAQAYDGGAPVLIGNVSKTDFETMFIAHGFLDWVSAAAVDHQGNVMGTSAVHRTKAPDNWEAAGFVGSSKAPSPINPSSLYKEAQAGEDHSSALSNGDTKDLLAALSQAYQVVRGLGNLLIFILVVSSFAGVLLGAFWVLRRRRIQRSQPYRHVPSEESFPMEETPLRNNASSD